MLRCRDAEKGPFAELVAADMPPAQTLTILLIDCDQPRVTITLHDWVALADRQLSPAAGWGVPVNCIRFERATDDPTSPVLIGATLAGTGIGRGWDSIGHAPGWYRSRITIAPCNSWLPPGG